MSDEILMNITPMESRVALIEKGVLQEVHVERIRNRGLVGNVYLGKVVRVLPGMQAAFVDVGLEKAAFIYVGELFQRNELQDGKPNPDISEIISESDSIVVQVAKDPLGTKGAKLTTQISFPARHVVFMPNNNHVGVSLRIEDADERTRLKELMEKVIDDNGFNDKGGFILRTVAETATEEELVNDVLFLHRLWASVEEKIKESVAPSCVYEDLILSLRTLRDLVDPEVEKICIDSLETYNHVCKFVSKLIPHLDGKIDHYEGERPLFDCYNVEDEIGRSLNPRVNLKSGGYLVIDQTEAMSTVDINTGGFVGHRNLEETIFKTNMEAAAAIARQIRLRNLGGMIIIDFIDMIDEEHKRNVLRILEKHFERDHAKIRHCGFSELGLVEMTRKRTRESLENTLCGECPTCSGRGTLKTSETVCYEIFREIMRESRIYDNGAYLVLVSEEVVDRLLDEESANVAELEEFLDKRIRFQVEPNYSQEQFDVVLV